MAEINIYNDTYGCFVKVKQDNYGDLYVNVEDLLVCFKWYQIANGRKYPHYWKLNDRMLRLKKETSFSRGDYIPVPLLKELLTVVSARPQSVVQWILEELPNSSFEESITKNPENSPNDIVMDVLRQLRDIGLKLNALGI